MACSRVTVVRADSYSRDEGDVSCELERWWSLPCSRSSRFSARASFPSIDLTEEQAGHVRVGRPLDLALAKPGPHAVFAPDGQFLALYEQHEQRARPVAVFV